MMERDRIVTMYRGAKDALDMVEGKLLLNEPVGQEEYDNAIKLGQGILSYLCPLRARLLGERMARIEDLFKGQRPLVIA